MNSSIAIAGAGVIGRLCALRLAEAGATVTLFDPLPHGGEGSCSAVGAGMLAPACELEHAEEPVGRLGLDSARRWADLNRRFGMDIELQQTGSLVVAHPQDEPELLRLRRKVEQTPWAVDLMRRVDGPEIQALEPGLGGRFGKGLYFSAEGHVNNDSVLAETTRALRRHPRVAWVQGASVLGLEPGRVRAAGGDLSFDLVVDARGLGARAEWPELRGVRGELIHVESPEVTLGRPVRLMHPRYPLYVVPRRGGRFVIGATMLESEDQGPMTVKSALELLSAAYTLHAGFSEARIVSLRTACRPALPHHEPRIRARDGLLRVNGLYRHGFLLAPVLSEAVERLALGQTLETEWERFVSRE